MNHIVWQHGWGLAGQILSLAAIIFGGWLGYLWLASQLGAYLHRRDVQSQFRTLLEREREAVASRRKARIDAWVTDEEQKYVDEVEAKVSYRLRRRNHA